MCFFGKIIEAHRRKIARRNAACQALLDAALSALAEMDAFLAADDFLDLRQGERILQSKADLRSALSRPIDRKFRKAPAYKKLLASRQEFNQKSAGFIQAMFAHNDKTAQRKLPEAYALIGDVEGRKPDRQQMLCIVKESYNHLVIAGAGTGKTTTIVGRIKYMLKKGLCGPCDILALSFTNASAGEIRERIRKETGQSVEASTFHKLGLNIIRICEGITPKITQINLRSFIREQLALLMEQPRYMLLLSSYLLFHDVAAKSEFEFSTESEYRDYLSVNPPATLKNERVKSYGEADIANFLAQNGIAYKYEAAYPIDTRTSEYSQYYPDFFLPEYNIYVEYFGINQKGEVPPYFSGKHGKPAAEIYRKSMEWKRRLHAKYGTVMIACFAYEKFSGNLLVNLEARLKEHNVVFKPKTPKEILDSLMAGRKTMLTGFIELAETVINLIKSNDYTIEQARLLVPKNTFSTTSDLELLNLIEPLYDAYCRELAGRREIDFNDMINVAARYAACGKYVHHYKYVIVDEYQDISKSRFSLLKALRDTNEYNLFCVGDDWQSIYRFAGSDIGFILNFGRYWGISETSLIETTYRFSQKLIDLSGGFIMKNPNQVRKAIRGNTEDTAFPLEEINDYTENDLAASLAMRLFDLPQDSTVFLIGRYSFDIDYIKNSQHFTCRYNNSAGNVTVLFPRRMDLKIIFLTAHRSKGLQADYVFILNNKKSRMGFPSEIQNAPILNLLSDNSDRYPYAEERRLFYVALTRVKKTVILLTLSGKESGFVTELRSACGAEIQREALTCPKCGGRLIKRSGHYGEFLGCSNYRTQGCTYKQELK